MPISSEDVDRVKQGAESARQIFRAVRQPSRAEERAVSGGVIGAPPVGYEAGTGTAGQTRSGGRQGSKGRSARYEENLAAKQARDRAAVAERERQRAAAGKSRYIGRGRGAPVNIPGGSPRGTANGGGASTAGMPWMDSPYYWLGIGAIAFLLLRKRKKKNGNGNGS